MTSAAGDIAVDTDNRNSAAHSRIDGGHYFVVAPTDYHHTGNFALNCIINSFHIRFGGGIV